MPKEPPKETLIAKIYYAQNARLTRLEEHLAELEVRVDELEAFQYADIKARGG